jgi:hypothetical protein
MLNASRGGASVRVSFQLEPNALAMVEPINACTFQNADVHHDFACSTIRCNQAETLEIIKIFHCAAQQTHAVSSEYRTGVTA